MLKLSNGQASLFQSDTIRYLLTSNDRCFPIMDAFRISDMIDQITSRFETYQKSIKKIIEENNGKIAEDGRISYADKSDEKRAFESIEVLNAVQIEILGDPIEISDKWPDLTLKEISILKPILKKTDI